MKPTRPTLPTRPVSHVRDASAKLMAVTAALALSACAIHTPGRLALGASVADAVRGLGPATHEDDVANATKRLEYSGGTYGKQTWMLDFDGARQLTARTQVRLEARFNQVLAGMTQTEVLQRIGHPSERSLLGFQKQTVWSYRFEGPFCVWFQVGLAADDRVVDTAYLPDPICEPLGFEK